MRCIEKTLYTNGRIVTMDAAGTVAEAVLVAGNVIEAVGSKDGLAALAGPGCRTVDLKGASLYPGFIDTHSHASLYAMWKTHCRCPGIAHLEDVYPLIRKQAERVRDGDGIVVYNFDDTDIPERRGPTKRELDAVMTGPCWSSTFRGIPATPTRRRWNASASTRTRLSTT